MAKTLIGFWIKENGLMLPLIRCRDGFRIFERGAPSGGRVWVAQPPDTTGCFIFISYNYRYTVMQDLEYIASYIFKWIS